LWQVAWGALCGWPGPRQLLLLLMMMILLLLAIPWMLHWMTVLLGLVLLL
jgi:hypothetical protein